MNREELLNRLVQLVRILQSLELTGAELMQKDRLVENITILSRVIVLNTLREGTQALEEASGRLTRVSEQLERDKQSVERTTENLTAVVGVLNALAGVVRFI
jgi:hypothetical protein